MTSIYYTCVNFLSQIKPYNMKDISVAKTILAILRVNQGGTLRLFERHPYFHMFCKGKSNKTCLSSLSRLKKAGLINSKGKNFLLSPEGRGEALAAFVGVETRLYLQKHHKWDGKWRMIFFDIPERKRQYRDYLRNTLKLLGFKKFQGSIWVYPHRAPSFLKQLLFEEEIKRHVRFITTEHIDNDQDLRDHFRLL